MDKQLIAAINAFNTDTQKTESAENAINTLISCFGDKCVDVTHHTLRQETVSDSYIESLYGNAPANERKNAYIDYFKRTEPAWDVIIWFPHETITNELGDKVDIYDFFVKVSIQYSGKLLSVSAIKSSYTEDQFYSGYIHSHCPGLEYSESGIKEWRSMCFGTGPIIRTINRLGSLFRDERLWVAFASELRQWVRTESTDGGPYRLITEISGRRKQVVSSYTERPSASYAVWLKPLIKSYIRAQRIKISYVGGRYRLGMPFTEWLIDFSKYAQAWGEKNGIHIPLTDTIITDNKINKITDRDSTEHGNLINAPVLDFKGKTITLKIVQGKNTEHMKLIKYQLGLYIVKNILNIINNNYGRIETTNTTTSIQWG